MNENGRKIAIAIAAILGVTVLLYLGGLLGQLLNNYQAWTNAGGMLGGIPIQSPKLNPLICFRSAFTIQGLKGMVILVAAIAAIILYFKFGNTEFNKGMDPRGFSISNTGTYGTAGWMTEKEMKEVFEFSTPDKAEGMILGERKGKVVCLPKDTRLNRHTTVFGASGTMKSRAVIRNMIFQCIKRGESVLVSDPKSELYNDCSELFRQNGYEVKVFNLVDPKHSDTWNCMADISDDTLMAQVLTNVIIGNTSQGKGDHFWDNGETNLLKAIVLYVAYDDARTPDQKNLWEVYQMLINTSEKQLAEMFKRLPLGHPAQAPYRLYEQASDNVRSGILLGLGTRLQVLQNLEVARLISGNDIDLTAPGSKKCAYFIILSDQETSMAFLSSLFFSFLFIKLTRFADSCPGGHCPIPVNLILDEFNNIGRIGGAPDGSDFARSLSVIRSRDIRVMLAVQSLGQLQNRYPNNLWAEIIGNCDIQLMLGCTDDVTANYFSARSGDMSIQVESTMMTKQTMAMAQMIPQYRETQGHGRRKLLTPDEVLRLPHNEMLVIIRGQNILKLTKFDYTKHPMSKDLVPVSILSYSPQFTYRPVVPVAAMPEKPVGKEEPKPSKFAYGKAKKDSSSNPPPEF